MPARPPRASAHPWLLALALASALGLCPPRASAQDAAGSPPEAPGFAGRLGGWIDARVSVDLAGGYGQVVPRWGQERVRSALRNLWEPRDAASGLLQGHPLRAGGHLARFSLNSTVGLAGLFDPAGSRLGLELEPDPFDSALARWGVPAGSPLWLPLLGETSPRGLAGRVLDGLLYPLSWVVPASAATSVSAGTLLAETVTSRAGDLSR